MLRFLRYLIMLAITALALNGLPAQAQGSLSYGALALGSVSATAPAVIYTFTGAAGDQVVIRVTALTPGFDPSVTLLGPDQASLGTNNNDTQIPGTLDARLSVTLPSDGLYLVFVTGTGGSTGDFVVKLDGVTGGAPPPPPPADTGADDTGPTATATATPTLTATASATPTVTATPPAVAQIAPPDGDVAFPLNIPLGGTASLPETVSYPDGDTTDAVNWTVTGLNPDPNQPGGQAQLTIRVTCFGTNLDQIQFDVGGQVLGCDQTLVDQVVTADAATGSVTITAVGGTGTYALWVLTGTASSAVETQLIDTTATATATATEPAGQPTATYTPSYTPTTPPAPQIAPDDAPVNPPLRVPLDETVSTLDFVSYPGGDREDRVQWDVTGMNNNVALTGGRARLTISASCFGENIDQIQFAVGGQTFGCGSTIVDRTVTADSRTGLVTITAVGGEGTYVQWVLTGTAIRDSEGGGGLGPTVTPTPPVSPTPTPTVTPTMTATLLDQVEEATATATATATVLDQIDGPTATYTPSYTPTEPAQQPTATYTPSYTPTTPPAPQIAPEDARFNNPLTIPLDNTVSVLDFVSYPGGDREDRVRWEVTGMNNNVALTGGRARLVIAVSCFGQNTDQIEFFTGGQTFACGQTLVDREITADQRTGSLIITAVGGEGTYVQWVLTGTATRLN